MHATLRGSNPQGHLCLAPRRDVDGLSELEGETQVFCLAHSPHRTKVKRHMPNPPRTTSRGHAATHTPMHKHRGKVVTASAASAKPPTPAIPATPLIHSPIHPPTGARVRVPQDETERRMGQILSIGKEVLEALWGKEDRYVVARMPIHSSPPGEPTHPPNPPTAQTHPDAGPGRRRQDHHPLPPPAGRGRALHPHHWVCTKKNE